MEAEDHAQSIYNYNIAFNINPNDERAVLGILKVNYSKNNYSGNISFSNNINFNTVTDPWIFIYLAKSNYEIHKNDDKDNSADSQDENELQKTAAFLNLGYKISKKDFLVVSKIVQLLFKIKYYNYVSLSGFVNIF